MEEFVPQVALYLALSIKSVALLVIVLGLIMSTVRALIRRVRVGGWFRSYEDMRKGIGGESLETHWPSQAW